MASIVHEHLYIDSCGDALLSRMQPSTYSTRARVGKSFACASGAAHSSNSNAPCIRMWPPGSSVDRIALRVDERHVVLAQDRRDRCLVVDEQLVHGGFPFALALPYAHRDLVVELDTGLRL